MVTRKEKRAQEKDVNYFFEFLKIKRHFFKDFTDTLKKVQDPRHQSYITYDCDMLLFMVILKNACNLESMRDMTESFNKDEAIKNIQKLFGIEVLEDLPHYDTINDFLSKLKPENLQNIRTYMIKELFKKRCFDSYRINGKYWGIIIDGTGLFTFPEKHCEHCLKRVYKDEEGNVKQTVYMHHVLEAKLVVGDIVLSIDSEFIENESEDVAKQDCELNAFYRLAERLKATYKRLPICILGDSLYACENVFALCEEYKWKYLLRFKEGRIKTVMDEFHELKKMGDIPPSSSVLWVNGIDYNDRKVNVLEKIVKSKKESKEKKPFIFITNIKVKKKNVQLLANAGRSRWKVENEGFNTQKNIRYYIKHANSHDYNAMKNHYLLTQIADILVQLYENGSKLLKAIKKRIKRISSDLLEAIRSRFLTDEDMIKLDKPIQVRFSH